MVDYLAGVAGASRSSSSDVAAALTALRDAVWPIACGRTASAAAARGLLDLVDRQDTRASAQTFINLFIATDRARSAARRSYGVGYDWRAWSEVSRHAEDCLIAAVRAMRNALTDSLRERDMNDAVTSLQAGPRV